MNIADFLAPQAVRYGLRAANKKKLIADIADFSAMQAGLDPAHVFEVLWQREKLGSTGTGHGVAVPHGRFARLERVIGAFVHLESAVDFESVDDVPVDLLFLLLTPQEAGADHLMALAKVSRLLRHAGVCEKLRAAPDEVSLYSVLIEPTSGHQAA